MSIQKVSLGKRLVLDEVFVDFSPSKKDLAEILHLCRTSVWKWDAIAYDLIEDYRNQYPILPIAEALGRKKYKCKKVRDTEVNLTDYQAWVISLIVSLAAILHKQSRVKDYISNNLETFSLARFEVRKSVVNQQAS